MNEDAARTGWYGKLPSLGDFASRRLAPDLIEAWDHWLADGLAHWREEQPDTWLDAYLAGPSWRFVLMPGVIPDKTPGAEGMVCGVLMPSVDRVGRYFPLTLMHACTREVAGTETQLSWLHRLDDLALDALQEDWEIDRFEAELARLDADEVTQQPDAIAALPELYRGQACWWRIGDDGLRLTHCTDGLPTGPAFIALLSGL
ncbi:type VI secretion system-associated protein TagF [Pelomonas sp. KK5]|uniref:type VI secretion system-associated protein TagF n=1 Tax=Pelomonas sp. KK5 TaxID=1855730 RepID=UPI00097C46C3|nr:type VI secretion system-associated protein TagF [Pelomonas sp. KK5]